MVKSSPSYENMITYPDYISNSENQYQTDLYSNNRFKKKNNENIINNNKIGMINEMKTNEPKSSPRLKEKKNLTKNIKKEASVEDMYDSYINSEYTNDDLALEEELLN